MSDMNRALTEDIERELGLASRLCKELLAKQKQILEGAAQLGPRQASCAASTDVNAQAPKGGSSVAVKDQTPVSDSAPNQTAESPTGQAISAAAAGAFDDKFRGPASTALPLPISDSAAAGTPQAASASDAVCLHASCVLHTHGFDTLT